MASSLEKGNDLEYAVRAIESLILRSSPTLVDKTFSIESKKIIDVSGVRHEIDLYVEFEIAKGYKSIFIFECKNWKKSVGKNEIIIFSEKIVSTNATRGFFIAKSFSRHAVAQSKKEQRMELLLTTEHDPAITTAPYHFHVVVRGECTARIEAISNDTNKPWAGTLKSVQMMKANINGTDLNFGNYAQEWIDKSVNDDLNKFPSATLPDDVYQRKLDVERTFENNKLVIDGCAIYRIKLHVDYSVRVIRPKVVSHFEVATRGRIISLEPISIHNGLIQLDFLYTDGGKT